MKTILTKEDIISAIQELPDDVRIADVIDELVYLQNVEIGLNEPSEEGVPHEEMMRILKEDEKIKKGV